MKSVRAKIRNFIMFKCTKLPYEITTIYQNAFLFMTGLLVLLQSTVLILQAFNIVQYGPNKRLFEVVGFTCLSVSAWVFCKYCRKYAYIYSGISGIIMLVAYFEIIIKYNEAEEGFLFFSIYSAISLAFLDLFRFYWVMVLYQVLITGYVYIRIMKFKFHTNIISTYDSIYYGSITCLIMCILFYIFTTIFNILSNQSDKTNKLLESWKIMMNSSPIGIIISKKQSIMYYNTYSQEILSKINLTVSSSSLAQLEKFEIVTQNNNIKTFKVQSSYIYYDSKQITFENEEATLTILNDLTKVFECQAQNNQQQMLEMLVATSTHELRTPLHYIKNTLQLVSEEGVSKEMESISRALGACEMQECYINDILDFAKLKADTLVLIKEPININDLLGEVYTYFDRIANENQLQLKMECKMTQLVVNADYIRLKQVLFNLISNALKFTQVGGITLRAYQQLEKVNIEIQDTGVGMTATEVNGLFKPFSVAESTRKYNKSGTGLGLFLSKKLCQLMDSDINVYSQKNIGSIFTICFKLLPQSIAYPGHQKRLSKTKSILIASSFNISGAKSNKVLIVDDNGFNCQILEKMLTSLNIESYKALNGNTALDIIRCNDDIKIAFIDLNMPFMDGYELLERINSYYTENKKEQIPIYALSGESSTETKAKCAKAGFTGHLSKPFTKQSLIEILNVY